MRVRAARAQIASTTCDEEDAPGFEGGFLLFRLADGIGFHGTKVIGFWMRGKLHSTQCGPVDDGWGRTKDEVCRSAQSPFQDRGVFRGCLPAHRSGRS